MYFILGSRPHIHEIQPGAALKTEVTAIAKVLASQQNNIYKSTATLDDCHEADRRK